MSVPGSITLLVAAADGGDQGAREQLFAALYDELRRLARRELSRGAGNAAELSPTTLVHEIYAGIAGREGLAFGSRGRFLAYAACAMRGFVIDAVRSGSAQKRGGEFLFTQLDAEIVSSERAGEASGLARLSDALDALAALEPSLAELVDLKFFCGFSFAEIAQLTGASERTAQRNWEKARLLLFAALRDV